MCAIFQKTEEPCNNRGIPEGKVERYREDLRLALIGNGKPPQKVKQDLEKNE